MVFIYFMKQKTQSAIAAARVSCKVRLKNPGLAAGDRQVGSPGGTFPGTVAVLRTGSGNLPGRRVDN